MPRQPRPLLAVPLIGPAATVKAIDQAFGYRPASRPDHGPDPSGTEEAAA